MTNGKVVISRHVVFDESRFLFSEDKSSADPTIDRVTMHFSVLQMTYVSGVLAMLNILVDEQ